MEGDETKFTENTQRAVAIFSKRVILDQERLWESVRSKEKKAYIVR